jgi:hypothetical protein
MLSTFVDTATDPRLLAFLAVGLSGAVLIGAWPSLKAFAANPSHHLRQLPKRALTVVREPAADAASPPTSQRLPRAVFAFGAIGVVLAAWAGYAFTQPASETHTVQGVRWENATSFTFTGHGPLSTALPDGQVGPVSAKSIADAGAPPVLYSKVLSSLDFAFKYKMQSDRKLEVLGTGGVALRIHAQDGWERTMTLQPPQQLIGPDVTLWFTLNLDAARLVIAGVERETGSHSQWYDLTIVPVVRMVGQQGAQHIDETYAPEYHLRYDPVHITPDTMMVRSEPQVGPIQQESSRRLSFLGLSLSFALARWLAGVVAIAALARAVMLVPSKPYQSAPPATSTPAPAKDAARPPAAKAAVKPPAARPDARTTAPAPPPKVAEAAPAAAEVEPAEPSAIDAGQPAPTTPPAVAPDPQRVQAEPRLSPETLRAAIQRNLAANAEITALLAESVNAASNGSGSSHSNGRSSEGDEPAGDSSAA